MLQVINFSHIRQKSLIIANATSKRCVKLADYFSNFAEILGLVGTLLELVHYFESEIKMSN